MSFLINNAYAEVPASTAPEAVGATQADGDIVGTILPFIIIFVVFYFLILRPQQKKFKLHQVMISAIKRGDKVITSGGILGKVTSVNDKEGTLQVEIADGIKVNVIAATISSVVSDAAINDNAIEKKK